MYRIVIADDETSIRNGIEYLIDWKSMDCEIVAACKNGVQVLEVVRKEKIDIVISDIRMPMMDGIELAKILHEEFPHVAVIILTAYSDFDYAKQALQCGVNDYIIKNEFIKELPQSIEETKRRLDEREKQRKKEQLTIANLKKNILEALMFDRLMFSENDIMVYGLDKKQYCVCCCEFSYEGEEKNRPNILRAMENFLGMASSSFEHYLLHSSVEGMIILLCLDMPEPFEVQDVFILFTEIMHIAEEFLRVAIKVGISKIVTVENLYEGYKQAEKALFYCTSSGNEIILSDEKGTESNWWDSFISLKNEMVKLLFERNYQQAEEKLKQVEKLLGSCCLPLETVQVNILSLCQAIFRTLDEKFEIEDIRTMEVDLYKQVYNGKTLFYLLKLCDTCFYQAKEILEQAPIDKHYLINAINDYIRKNCCENLTLRQISDAVHASTSYISRLYKKKTGVTLTTAINRLRIQRAKTLLKDSTYKIYEIAQMVGIEDAGYFTNLFIRYEGCSPSEYRGIQDINEEH